MASQRAEIKKLRRQMEEGARMHDELLRENARLDRRADIADHFMLCYRKRYNELLSRESRTQGIVERMQLSRLGRLLLSRYE